MEDTAVNYDLNSLVPTMWFQGDRASPTTHFLDIFRTQILLQQQNHLQNEKKIIPYLHLDLLLPITYKGNVCNKFDYFTGDTTKHIFQDTP